MVDFNAGPTNCQNWADQQIKYIYINLNTNVRTRNISFHVVKMSFYCKNIKLSVQGGRSPALYVGSTIRHLYERVAEHAGVSARTSNPVHCPSFSSIREHSKTCNCKISLDNFEVLGSVQNEYSLRILESLYIHRKRPNLNNQVSSSPLLIIE